MELTSFFINLSIFLFTVCFFMALYCNWKKDKMIGNVIQLFFTAIIIILYIEDVYLKISLQRTCIIDILYIIVWSAFFIVQCLHIKNYNYRNIILIDGNNHEKIKLNIKTGEIE